MCALELARFLIRGQVPGVKLAEWRRGAGGRDNEFQCRARLFMCWKNFVIVKVNNKKKKLEKYPKLTTEWKNPSLNSI